MSEIEKLKKKIEELAKEVEELKKTVCGKPRKELSIHDPHGVSKALEKSLEDVEEGSAFVCAGVIKKGKEIHDSWNFDFSLEEVFEIHPRRIVNLISPLTSEQRINILRIILKKRTVSMSQLSKETGLEGGELYHHLRELLRRGYIKLVKRGTYTITIKGEIALIIASGIAYAWESPVEEELEVEESRQQGNTSSTN
ncbi:MAG: hypothetical protein DRJ35_01520 [Thermoprotei archaeon]|nr:MAG: hypothetical protein DRJ35_01520 [Thermoprotei archaeon]